MIKYVRGQRDDINESVEAAADLHCLLWQEVNLSLSCCCCFFNRLGEIRRCERRTSSPGGRRRGRAIFYLQSDLSYKINKFLSSRDMLQAESKFN